VRAIIFNKLSATSLTQKHILTLRLVCQQWRHEIDEFCDFSAIIDDRKQTIETLQRISQLRLKSLSIYHLTDATMSSFSLKQPTLLKILKVPLPSVQYSIVDTILHESGESLIELQISFPLIQSETSSEIPNANDTSLCLRNLKKLRISFSSLPSPTSGNFFVNPSGDAQCHSATLLKLLAPPSPQLETFRLDLRCLGFSQMSLFTGIVLAFVADRWASLKSLNLELIQGNHGIPSVISQPLSTKDLDRINLSNLRKCINLKSFRLINSSSLGINLFSQLLAQQGNLRFVETDILPAPMSLYTEMVRKSRHTLVEIDIGDITIDLDEQGPFDLTVFQHCTCLKKLTLDRNCLHRRVFEDEQHNFAGDARAELINLFNLPPCLEELALNYFLVLSDEFIIYFSNKDDCRLRSLSLTQCGDFGEFGVDGSVLETIITLRDIEMIEISRLNFSLPEERVKLNLILNAFGYDNDHAYFQLIKRGSDEDEEPEYNEFSHSLDDLEI